MGSCSGVARARRDIGGELEKPGRFDLGASACAEVETAIAVFMRALPVKNEDVCWGRSGSGYESGERDWEIDGGEPDGS